MMPVAQEPIEEMAQEPIEEIAQEPIEEIAQEPIEEITQEPIEQFTGMSSQVAAQAPQLEQEADELELLGGNADIVETTYKNSENIF